MSKGPGGLGKTQGGGGGGNKPPVVETLLDAVSEIQQFHVIEASGQEIPKEFLTINDTLKFLKIGLKSGLRESLILVMLFPILEFWMVPFVLQKADLSLTLIVMALPFMGVLVNTGICAYIGRYYIGNITRKSINSLFMGRSTSLLIKAGLTYIFYFFIVAASTPKVVAQVAMWFGPNAEAVYNGFYTVKPAILPTATKTAIGLVCAAVIPYASVYGLDWLRRWKHKRTLAGQINAKR